MRIVVAGGSGFLGRPLCQSLAAAGHDIVILTRQAPAPARGPISYAQWNPHGGSGPWASVLHHADAVVNLAGESLAGGRWTAGRKRLLVDSRLQPTRSLVHAMREAPAPPDVFLSASGINYYGAHGDETITEQAPAGHDFTSRLCVDWEKAAGAIANPATRVVCVRTGPVLGRHGGLLPSMLLPFKLFFGGPLGSGRQYLSWIHLTDWVRLAQWIIETPTVGSGPVNATAPTPVTNADFSTALGRALHRPSWLPVPAFAVRIAVGEMATLALTGQRALPARATDLGFTFRFSHVGVALQDVLG